MKKIALSLAGVLVAAAFAPEASAIPSFSRQTGKSCNSCHFQHFPVLNGTGQEFKNGGFTQMNANGKFKDDDLSIPDSLNASILLKARYQKENGTDAAGAISGVSKNGGQWQIPDELSLFFGGRIADNGTIKIGYMNENNLAGSPMVAGFKLPVVIQLQESLNVQVIPYMTESLGQAYGYELSSTGISRGVRWAEHREETSAAHFTDAGGYKVALGSTAASGIAYVISSDMGYINLSRWSPNFTFAKSAAVQMSSSWLRVAATPTFGEWSAHIALGMASGSNYVASGTPTVYTKVDTKGSVFDVQLQGSLAEMETSFYFSTMTAGKSSATNVNYFNKSTLNDRKATVIAGDLTVIPHTLTVGLAYRKGTNADAAASSNNAVTVTAIYDLFQNVALHADYSKYSGTKPSGTYGVGTDYGTGSEKDSLLTLMLEAAW